MQFNYEYGSVAAGVFQALKITGSALFAKKIACAALTLAGKI